MFACAKFECCTPMKVQTCFADLLYHGINHDDFNSCIECDLFDCEHCEFYDRDRKRCDLDLKGGASK